MSIEIERRFIVKSNEWETDAHSPQNLRQGYLVNESNGWIVRIRISDQEKAWLTLKSKLNKVSSNEFEYELPINEAEEIWKLTSDRIHKTRYHLNIKQETWVIDCFHGANKPLIIAEIELKSSDQKINIPNWCGPEVSGQYQWSNASLAKKPISLKAIESSLTTQNEPKGHSFL